MRNVYKMYARFALFISLAFAPLVVAACAALTMACEKPQDRNVEQTPGVEPTPAAFGAPQDDYERAENMRDLVELQKFVRDNSKFVALDSAICEIDRVNDKAKAVEAYAGQVEGDAGRPGALKDTFPITFEQAGDLRQEVAKRVARLVFSIPTSQLTADSPCDQYPFRLIMDGALNGLHDAGLQVTDAGFVNAEVQEKIGRVLGLELKECLHNQNCDSSVKDAFKEDVRVRGLNQHQLGLTDEEYAAFKKWPPYVPAPIGSNSY